MDFTLLTDSETRSPALSLSDSGTPQHEPGCKGQEQSVVLPAKPPSATAAAAASGGAGLRAFLIATWSAEKSPDSLYQSSLRMNVFRTDLKTQKYICEII
ncbi:hypothetical protein XENOCAPTIV_003188 [Xenoophorus captivus]|uniref:Uncharacterized protein n=1 Tax=Xenoophorus captivus TaxID=1517983 RepID=A0ABV0R7U8_9TELE